MSDPTQPIQTIRADDCLDPEGSIVESGRRLADAVVKALDAPGSVHVQLDGIKGASSSYFNVLLTEVKEHGGLDQIGGRLSFRFSSNVQEAVFHRSLEAVRRIIQHPRDAPLRS